MKFEETISQLKSLISAGDLGKVDELSRSIAQLVASFSALSQVSKSTNASDIAKLKSEYESLVKMIDKVNKAKSGSTKGSEARESRSLLSFKMKIDKLEDDAIAKHGRMNNEAKKYVATQRDIVKNLESEIEQLRKDGVSREKINDRIYETSRQLYKLNIKTRDSLKEVVNYEDKLSDIKEKEFSVQSERVEAKRKEIALEKEQTKEQVKRLSFAGYDKQKKAVAARVGYERKLTKYEKETLRVKSKINDFEEKMKSHQGGKIKSVKKQIQYIKTLGNQLDNINLSERKRIDLVNKINLEMKKANTLANKGSIGSDFMSNLSPQKMISRASFVMTARAAYKAMDLLADGIRNVISVNIELQDELSKTFSIMTSFSDTTRQVFSNEVLRVMAKYNMELKDVTDSLYQIVSAQIPKDNVLMVLNESAKLAKANFSELKATADLMTTIINAYDFDPSEASFISDMVSKTVELGKTTVQELSEDLARVIPTAKNAGVQFSELSAALAIMTKNGIKTNQSVTSLRQLIATLTTPTSKNIKLLEKYGLSYGAVNLAQDGLLKTMEKYSVLLTDEQFQIAKTRTGRDALLTLIGELSEGYEYNEKILNSIGATEKMVGERTDTFSSQLDTLGKNILATFNSTPITSWATDVIRSINDVMGAWTKYSDVAYGNRDVETGSIFDYNKRENENIDEYIERLKKRQKDLLDLMKEKTKASSEDSKGIMFDRKKILKASTMILPDNFNLVKKDVNLIKEFVKDIEELDKLILTVQSYREKYSDENSIDPEKILKIDINNLITEFEKAKETVDKESMESLYNYANKIDVIGIDLERLGIYSDKFDNLISGYLNNINNEIAESLEKAEGIRYSEMSNFKDLPMETRKAINDMVDKIKSSTDPNAVRLSSDIVFKKIIEEYGGKLNKKGDVIDYGDVLNPKSVKDIINLINKVTEAKYLQAFKVDSPKDFISKYYETIKFEDEKYYSWKISQINKEIDAMTNLTEAQKANLKNFEIGQLAKEHELYLKSGLDAKSKKGPSAKKVGIGENIIRKYGYDPIEKPADDASEEDKINYENEINQRIADSAVSSAQQTISNLTNLWQQYYQQKLQMKLDNLEDERLAEVETVNTSIMTSEHRQNEINAINSKYEKKKAKETEKAEKKQAKLNKKMAIGQAFMDFASGNMNIWSVWGSNLPMALFLEAMLASAFASNLAVINKQKFATGGILDGPSHANGGIQLMGSGGYFGEAEGGEAIISRKATKGNEGFFMSANDYLSRGGSVDEFINGYMNGVQKGKSFFGKTKYENGGITSPNNMGNINNLLDKLNNMSIVDASSVDGRELYRIVKMNSKGEI